MDNYDEKNIINKDTENTLNKNELNSHIIPLPPA